jgi:thioredoxin reductase (NADPH)
MKKHGSETGLPVVVDFYSDSCGPCRMMAPIFKQVAEEFKDTAVFVKVDTNALHELSSRYQIRSLPTFQWFVGGKQWNEAKGGIGEAPLRQMTSQAVTQAEAENVRLQLEDFIAYYQQVDASKPQADVESVYQKCAGMGGSNKSEFCEGSSAQQLIRKLKKKYKQTPTTSKRFTGETTTSEDESSSSSGSSGSGSGSSSSAGGSSTKKQPGSSGKPNLHLATKEQLMEALEKLADEERDAEVETETDDAEEELMEQHRWAPGSFPERVVIVGAGPAGMAAAIYAARAGLSPLVIAPPMGGQLQGKGVDVENYPGVPNVTGPAVIAAMRAQAAAFGAIFEEDFVIGIDASSRPLKVQTNATGNIEAHSIIVATGAESNWLGVKGEYEMRGGGVSSCATCDGFLFAHQEVCVVGGGDAAMEDALVLARTSKSVTLIHRRDSFRASKVLANRVIAHPVIKIEWNSVVEEIVGKPIETDEESENMDLDTTAKVVSGVVLKDVNTNKERRIRCDAVFVAIGHTPTTSFLKDVVEFDTEHPGYLKTVGTSTKTSIAGIFAAGDVGDAVYRQAVTSAGSGAAAALDAERWLSEEGLGNEEAEMEAELLAEMMNDSKDTELGYNAYADADVPRMQGMKESIAAEL